MGLSNFIAARYYRSKSNWNIVNIISGSASFVLMVAICSFFIVLSVFSGLKNFGTNYSKAFDPVLISLPQMVLPIALFATGNYFYSFSIGCLMVGATGALGILLKEQVFNLIIKAYKSEKYSTLKAYKQN